jgi:hypothetical protein
MSLRDELKVSTRDNENIANMRKRLTKQTQEYDETTNEKWTHEELKTPTKITQKGMKKRQGLMVKTKTRNEARNELEKRARDKNKRNKLTTYSQESVEANDNNWTHQEPETPTKIRQKDMKKRHGSRGDGKQGNETSKELEKRARDKHEQVGLTNDSQEHQGSTHYTRDRHERRHPTQKEQEVSKSVKRTRKHNNEHEHGRKTRRHDKHNGHTHSGLTRDTPTGANAREQDREHAFRHDRDICHDRTKMNKQTRSAQTTWGHTQEQCTTQQHTHHRNSHRKPPTHCQRPTKFKNHKRGHHTHTHTTMK